MGDMKTMAFADGSGLKRRRKSELQVFGYKHQLHKRETVLSMQFVVPDFRVCTSKRFSKALPRLMLSLGKLMKKNNLRSTGKALMN